MEWLKVQNCRANNGVFTSKKWTDHCNQRGQGMTFAAVGAHFQNARSERWIRELQEVARTTMIHANGRWPKAVDAHLWPHTVRMANDACNEAMGTDGSPSPASGKVQLK